MDNRVNVSSALLSNFGVVSAFGPAFWDWGGVLFFRFLLSPQRAFCQSLFASSISLVISYVCLSRELDVLHDTGSRLFENRKSGRGDLSRVDEKSLRGRTRGDINSE